jgi:hypothetical protein
LGGVEFFNGNTRLFFENVANVMSTVMEYLCDIFSIAIAFGVFGKIMTNFIDDIFFRINFIASSSSHKRNYFIKYRQIFIGFIGFSKYAVIILIIGSLFLNYLILLFSAKNNEIPENLLKIESCSIDESLLFKNYNDEVAYFQKEEAKEINDIDFLNRLESISNISIPNQHTKK